MSDKQKLQDIIRTALVGRANREETVVVITGIVDALCLEAQERGYVKGKDDGYTAGHEDGYDEGHSDGKSEGKSEGRNEGVNLAVERIREYGYGIPYQHRERAQEIARGVY